MTTDHVFVMVALFLLLVIAIGAHAERRALGAPTYRQYRGWGHPPWTAWTLSCTGIGFYGGGAWLGLVVGWWFL